MDVIESQVDTRSEQFRRNRDQLAAAVAELRERTALVRRGGGERYIERHRQQGKLPVRERIEKLLDPGSPFLELSALAAGTSTTTTRPRRGSSRGSGGSRAARR
jgi:acetyl-CoA carboxylase carboxyltransferase component